MKSYGFAAIGLCLMGLAACTDIADEDAKAAEPKIQTTHTQRGNGQPYEMTGSQVWDVPDPKSGRGYQVFVSLPDSYDKNPQRHYPVLYVTDADYAFPIVRQISRRLNVEDTQVDDFILVGLSYAAGDTAMDSRRRDYTPTPNGPKSAPAGAVHGQGPAYQTYVRDQVKPFIEKRFRVDPARNLFLGHSYGALLGAQILLSEPEMFSGYILGSPSFWYDDRVITKLEAGYAGKRKDLPARVYMYVGAYEAVKPGDPRFNSRNDMVADMQAFERLLKSRHYRGLTVSSDVLNDEGHVTVAPRGFTHGLLNLFPAGAP